MSVTDIQPVVSLAVRERLAREPHLFVDGRARPATTATAHPVVDPATGATIASTAYGTAADIDHAVEAARSAFDPPGTWRQMSPLERGRVLHRIGDVTLERADEFAELEVLDGGKVRGAARAIDVEFASRALEQVKRVTLELGGRSTTIVAADADLDTAVLQGLPPVPESLEGYLETKSVWTFHG